MADRFPKFEEDVEVISKLGDTPGVDNGLTSAQLKAKFDQAPIAIKAYLLSLVNSLEEIFSDSGGAVSGGNLTGGLNMNYYPLTGLKSPEGPLDAVNKGFLDSVVQDINAAISEANAAFFRVYPGAGAHNAIYRGKNLGDHVTDAQWAAIKAGTFEDLYIGDFWVINDITWRIAAFDYYYRTGDQPCTAHHAVIVPDTVLYNAPMNDTNTTDGAYVGSKMYKEGLSKAKTMIQNAFGAAHILQHRRYLQNASSNSYASAGIWYDSTVELMSEQNVYGCRVFGNCVNGTAFPNNYTLDNCQYPLFTHRHDIIANRSFFWLRDIGPSNSFCVVGGTGNADASRGSSTGGVRPAFSICADQ